MAIATHCFRRPRLEELEKRELLTVVMTPQEQLIVELVNRARADPLAEAERYGIDLNDGVAAHEGDENASISPDPKQPLAPHQALTNAAGLHTQDMLDRDYFGHDNPEGLAPADRARNAGYPTGAGENIAWSGNTQSIDRNAAVYDVHQDLFESVGHRINMMRENWREIGPGVRYGLFTRLERGRIIDYQSIMVGTLLGDRRTDHFITGVAINDAVSANNFYEMGEGLGGVTITAVSELTGESFSDVTGPTGGYGIEVPPGLYTVTATGGAVRNPITVRSVQIAGVNKKIDFNTRGMPTGDIGGELFQDLNGNGRKDSGDAALAERTMFIDLDDDGLQGANEPTTLSDSSGRFVFRDLWPGEYVVKQALPPGWEETAPSGTIMATLRGNNDAFGAQFGSRMTTHPPTAEDDSAVANAGQSVIIAVLGNDSDPENDLSPQSIQVTTPPTGGTVTLAPGNAGLTYTADAGFAGTDTFRYTVADSHDARSNEATVQVLVLPAESHWHNLAMPNDVNDDGMIMGRDALVILREIYLHGAGSLAARNQPSGPPYLDVNDDGLVTASDALAIIRYVHLRSIAAAAAVDVAIAALDRDEADQHAVLMW